MMKRLLYIFPLLASLFIYSCENNCTDCDFPSVKPAPPTVATRVLFHYMAGDNDVNMSNALKNNVQDMIKGATTENMNGGAIIVFEDILAGNPRLLCIYPSTSGQGIMSVLKEYSTDLVSSDPKTFATAWHDAQSFITTDSWMLSLGSHGMGWMPSELHRYVASPGSRRFHLVQSNIRDPFINTRAFLQDGNSWMEIDEFAAVVPDDTFELIMLDLCFMSCIEYAYMLRDKADYLILSPAEVLMYGMPYKKVIKHIFADQPRFGENGVCEEFHDFYLTFPSASNRFATIAMFDCSQMDDFALFMREKVIGPNEVRIKNMTRNEVNLLNFYDRYPKRTMFDLASFVYALYPEGDPIRIDFDEKIAKLIPYKKTTGQALDGWFYVKEEWYSGVSSYIPIAEYDELTTAYWKTEWAKAVYPSL